MYEALTLDIHVSVRPEYLERESAPEEGRFVWAYAVAITNRGQETVRLLARHWRITDARGQVHEVRGEGVVGQQPVLRPGESFSYTSGCPLDTPHGSMVGSYRMTTEAGRQFDVAIPAFPLQTPHLRPTLH